MNVTSNNMLDDMLYNIIVFFPLLSTTSLFSLIAVVKYNLSQIP